MVGNLFVVTILGSLVSLQQAPASQALSHDIIKSTEDWVRSEMESSGNDASHDWNHVTRVRSLALKIANAEGLDSGAKHIVELSALLHDVKDYKYSGSDVAGPEAARAFLAAQGVTEEVVTKVVDVVSRVSYKKELALLSSQSSTAGMGATGITSPPTPFQPSEISKELACVQDADRLDAIGAIGIARCFTFGGARGRPIYDPEHPPRPGLTAEEYALRSGSTVNHFHEKLLRLRGLMKTDTGRKLADERHAFMESFLEQLGRELDALN